MSFLPKYEEVEDVLTFEDTASLAHRAEVSAYNCLRSNERPTTKEFRCFIAEGHAANLEQREEQLRILNDLLAADFTGVLTEAGMKAGTTIYRAVIETRELRSYDLRDLLEIAEDHELDLTIEYQWQGYLRVSFQPYYEEEDEGD